MYYLSYNFVFAQAKIRFSHDTAHFRNVAVKLYFILINHCHNFNILTGVYFTSRQENEIKTNEQHYMLWPYLCDIIGLMTGLW